MTTNYDDFAKDYASQNRMDHPLRRAVYERWLQACGNVSGIAAIDFGCGAGASTVMLADAGASYVLGIDKSKEMLTLASYTLREYAGDQVERGKDDIFDYVRRGKFTLATAVLSMHYAQTREQLGVFFNNIGYALLAGGRFAAVLMDPDNPIMKYWPGTMCSSQWLDKPWQEGSRIESDLYGADGNKFASVIDYYWTRQTHEELMLKNNLVDIQWTKDGALLQTPLVLLTAKKV